jgi:hypothetical protein
MHLCTLSASHENILQAPSETNFHCICSDVFDALYLSSLIAQSTTMNSVEIWVNKEKVAGEQITLDSGSPMTSAEDAGLEAMRMENTSLEMRVHNENSKIECVAGSETESSNFDEDGIGMGADTKKARRAYVDLDSGDQFGDCENDHGNEYDVYPHTIFWERFVDSFSWWSYGRMDTCLALSVAIAAFTLSLKAKGSTSFVTLDNPLPTKEDSFAPLTEVGLFFVKLCEIHLTEEQSLSRGKLPYRVVSPTLFQAGTTEVASSQCHVERWQHGSANDSLWDMSRVSSTLSTCCGGTVVIWLLLGICFEGLNVRALAVLAIGAFWFETMTFLIFGSDVCDDQGCAMSLGSKYAAEASVLWFIGSVTIFRLYVNQFRNFVQVEYQDTSTDTDECKPDINKSKKLAFESSATKKSKKEDTPDRTMASTASMLFKDSRSATTVVAKEHNERDESIAMLMEHHAKDHNRAYTLDLILEDETQGNTDIVSMPSPG